MAQNPEQPAVKKQKCGMGSMFDLNDFNDAAAVRELAAAGERLVCLQFPEGLGSLYCHSCFLSFSSPVLRNVLDDTQQQQGELCTIPLAGDSDVSVWKLALGLIYRLKAATITLDNAQALLLLAHKYDMGCIMAEVEAFLMGSVSTGSYFVTTTTRLKSHLSPSTVNSWLAASSKCGLQQLVQLCIDYLLTQSLPVDMDLLNSLDPTHAGQLLAAMQQKIVQASSQARQANSQLALANGRVDSVLQRHLSSGGALTAYTCSACKRKWISKNSFTLCCKVATYQTPVQLS